MAIHALQKISVNHSEQWILVRGKNENAPLILQVQAGPGIPHICYADAMQANLGWENEYLVTYWDQRGCGKSFSKGIDPDSISMEQYADDILTCTEYLLKKYQKEKLILIGYSLGATAALMAASKNNTLFSHLLLVGIDVDLAAANTHAMDFIIQKATQRRDKKILKEVDKLQKTPITTAKLFEKRAQLVSKYGGMVKNQNYSQLFWFAIKSMWKSKEYRLNDILKTIKGMNFCQNILLPKIETFNLHDHEIDTALKMHFVHGATDAISPLFLIKEYIQQLHPADITYTFFENSAHMPQLEEPSKFYGVLKTATATTVN